MGSGNGLATWSIASILSRATRETMWPSSVSARRCPVTTTLWAADRVRHLPCCCAQHATVEYWQGGARGRKVSSPRLSMTARRSYGPMEAQDQRPWRKIDVILSRHELRERDPQRRQRNADNGLRG